MRDFQVLIQEDEGLDIDIINGEASYVEYATRTQDQRAALAIYAVKGTVPGARDYGVAWSDQYTQDNTVAQLNNQIQQQLAQEAGIEGLAKYLIDLINCYNTSIEGIKEISKMFNK